MASWTSCSGTPAPRSSVAKECRRLWGLIRSAAAMPARRGGGGSACRRSNSSGARCPPASAVGGHADVTRSRLSSGIPGLCALVRRVPTRRRGGAGRLGGLEGGDPRGGGDREGVEDGALGVGERCGLLDAAVGSLEGDEV